MDISNDGESEDKIMNAPIIILKTINGVDFDLIRSTNNNNENEYIK